MQLSNLLSLFDNASSIMTLLSFITFIGILAWTFILRRADDFDAAAALPFSDASDESDDSAAAGKERHV